MVTAKVNHTHMNNLFCITFFRQIFRMIAFFGTYIIISFSIKQKTIVVFNLRGSRTSTYTAEQACFRAWEHDNRVPDLVINVLYLFNMDERSLGYCKFCRAIKIPYYIVFAPYHVASRMYLPPFFTSISVDKTDPNREERHECVNREGQTDWNENELITLEEGIPFGIGLERLKVVQGKGKCKVSVNTRLTE